MEMTTVFDFGFVSSVDAVTFSEHLLNTIM